MILTNPFLSRIQSGPDYLIATDLSQSKEKDEVPKESNVGSWKSRQHAKIKLDSEFGVVRGIDFKNVYTVCKSSLISLLYLCLTLTFCSAYAIFSKSCILC